MVGGGAQSNAWASVLAGAFDLPVVAAGETEAAALGAALQAAAVASGASVAAFVREHAPPPEGSAVLPLPEHAAHYAAAFAAFVEAGQTLYD